MATYDQSITETATPGDLWFPDVEFEDEGLLDTVTPSESYIASRIESPLSPIITETVTPSESYVGVKTRGLQDSFSAFDFFCVQVDVARGWSDNFQATENYNRRVNDWHDSRNNPVTLPGGSGFQMKGTVRRRLLDPVHVYEAWKLFDALGNEINPDPCGELIVVTVVNRWGLFTESDWFDWTEAEWGSFGE